MSTTRRGLWFAVIPAMFVPFAGALLYFMICDDASTARSIYVAAKIFLVAWPLLMYFTVIRGRTRLAPAGASSPARAALRGMVSGFGISLIIVALMLTPLGRTVEAGADLIRERAGHLGILAHYWSFAVFLSVAHSLIEEYYWRWFVYGGLRILRSRTTAITVSSLVFASHHVIITSQLMGWPLGLLCGAGVAVGGAFWARLYDRTGRLIAPWISHALVDFAIMSIGYILLQQ